jgi:hypothetical protein
VVRADRADRARHRAEHLVEAKGAQAHQVELAHREEEHPPQRERLPPELHRLRAPQLAVPHRLDEVARAHRVVAVAVEVRREFPSRPQRRPIAGCKSG